MSDHDQVIERLGRIETKLDVVASEVAEMRGAEKERGRVRALWTAVIAAVSGGLAGHLLHK